MRAHTRGELMQEYPAQAPEPEVTLPIDYLMALGRHDRQALDDVRGIATRLRKRQLFATAAVEREENVRGRHPARVFCRAILRTRSSERYSIPRTPAASRRPLAAARTVVRARDSPLAVQPPCDAHQVCGHGGDGSRLRCRGRGEQGNFLGPLGSQASNAPGKGGNGRLLTDVSGTDGGSAPPRRVFPEFAIRFDKPRWCRPPDLPNGARPGAAECR